MTECQPPAPAGRVPCGPPSATRGIWRTGVLLSVAALLSAAPLPLLARQADTTRSVPVDTTLFRVQGITVQTQRPVTTTGGTSAVEVRVESLVLPAAPTTGEVLREIAGVQVRTNSRGQAEISVRGSGSRQVAILYDGIPLTLTYDARTDVSVLPAAALREIHFVRGLSTLLHGPNVLGGVVEMNAARGSLITGDPRVEGSAGVDHVGGYSTAAHTTVPFTTLGGRGMVRAGLGFRDSPGVPLPGNLAESVDTGDDLRLNTDFRNVDGFGAFRYEADGGGWGSLSATTHQGNRGIAPEMGAEGPRFWRYPDMRRTIVAASAGTGSRGTPAGRGSLEASLGYDTGVTDIRSYASAAYQEVDGFEDGEDTTVSLRLLGTHSLGGRGEVRSSFTRADIRREEDIDGDVRRFQQELTSLAAESRWRLVDRPGAPVSALNLAFGGAWDRGTTPLTGGLESLPTIDDWGGRVGVSAVVNEGNTMLHLGANRRGRFPALREVYSEALNRFLPNPDLRPETLVALEGGVTSLFAGGEIQVVGFRQRLTDAIRRISLPDGRRQRVNADELTSTGVEILFSRSLGPLEVGGEVTLQSVELTDPSTSRNTEPENVPERAGSGFLRLPAVAGISTTLEGAYTGTRFCIDPDSGDDVRLDEGSWFDAVLSRVWSLGGPGGVRRLETRLTARNLGNTTLYDGCGLPRPGRLFGVQLRVF
jgi:iron complex outermembrane recepter protein